MPTRKAASAAKPKNRSTKTPAKRQPRVKAPAKPEKSATPTAFPIVGIGASAGGLEAFSALLKHLPATTGLAFVLVQHLDPKHDSILTELLAKETTMPVQEVTDGLRVQPNHVYVIPPNVDLDILQGKLRLTPRDEGHHPHMPIDHFFRSLSLDHTTKAVGIILSGTGTDGTLGLQAIKAAGGLTFAQDDKSAKYDGMPRSAQAAGVDFCLTPEAIAQELAQLTRHPYVAQAPTAPPDELLLEGEDSLSKLYLLLRNTSGVDFSYYKATTLKRRIARRMVLHKIERLPHYLRYLKDNPDEVEALYADLLINVTGFFREPEMYEALKKKVLPRLLKDRSPQLPLRIWVAGCSTGEEVYSIAICVLEYLNSVSHKNYPVQIFGTDVSEAVIEKARAGLFLENIAQDVSPERLRRFFNKTDNGYQVNKTIRDLCIFARQDITKDPPFSKVDLLSCCNLLIYLTQPMQRKVIATFHYALRPNGVLLLGSSETIGSSADLFMLIDKKHKIYSRKSVLHRVDYGHMELPATKSEAGKRPAEAAGVLDMQREVDRVLLTQYAPAGVLVNDNLDIVQFRGHTGNYLEPAMGTPSLNLLKMAREDLVFDLRSALQEARQHNQPVQRLGSRLRINGSLRRVNVHITPIVPAGSKDRYWLIMFEETAPSTSARRAATQATQRKTKATTTGHGGRREAQLEQELIITKEYLHSAIEQLETTNEELRSALEEVQSSNEELQSTNEELETAKEELQSTNEELTTVNEELQNRNFELSGLNNDLINLIGGSNIPIAILGSDLRIRRFTPMAEKVLNLIATDIGRPISDIRLNVTVPDLEQIVLDIMDKLEAREFEVQDRAGHWYSMRIRPYKTVDHKIDGVLIAWLDIDALKRVSLLTQAALTYVQDIVETVHTPLLILDRDLCLRTANHAFYQLFEVTSETVHGRAIQEIGVGRWDGARVRDWLTRAPFQTNGHDSFELEVRVAGTAHAFALNARRTSIDDQQTPLTIVALQDVTVA